MKMHAKGYNLGNTCREIPRHSSSFIPIIPQQGGFDLSDQYVRNHVGFSTHWHNHPRISHSRDLIRSKITAILYRQVEQASDVATILENWLFNGAASEEEYVNQTTLMPRLQILINKLHGTKYSQQVNSSITSTSKTVPSSGLLHAWSNGSLAEPAFQNLAGPIINSTDHCTMAVNNKYGFPKGGLSHTSIVHGTVCSPDDHSSITSCTDMDMFSNFSVSGGTSNFETSSKSISVHYEQQRTDDLEMDLIKYRDCLGTNQKNESMAFPSTVVKSPQYGCLNSLIPQHVSREISQVSTVFPNKSSSSKGPRLGDSWQYQSWKLDFQQNFRHLNQPHGHHSNASMARSSSCFVDQGEHCSHILGQKTLEQPWLPTRLPTGDQVFTSESSAGLFGLDGAASVNSCNSSEVSLEQKILLAYLHYKNLNNVTGDNQISFIKYLHSTVCGNGMCSCEWYIRLLLHFDMCQSDGCHICRPWKSLRVTGNLEPHLDSMITDSTISENSGPFGNSEAMLPPAKRPKVEPAFGVSLINNAIPDLWAPEMVQPYSSEGLSELQQQQESPLSIYSEVTESNMEQLINPTTASMSTSDIRNSVIDDAFEQTCNSETILSEGLEAGQISEESHPKGHHVISDSLGISNIKNSVSDDTFEQTFNSETIISEGFEAGRILEESHPKGHHVISDSMSISNIKNSVSDDTFEQTFNSETILSEGLEAGHISEESHPKGHHVMSDSMSISNIKNSVIDDTFEQTCNSETIISEGLEADDISEQSHPEGHHVIASSNLMENAIRSNSSMQTLCIDPRATDVEDTQGRTGFNDFDQVGKNATKEVFKLKADQDKETKSSNTTVNGVSLTEFFTYNQIKDHIMSLRQHSSPNTTDEEGGISVNSCQLCATDKLFFAPVPMYCLRCGNCIKRNANYYCRRAEEFDAQNCFCTSCFRNSRGGCITYNGISVSKTLLDRKRNDCVTEEPWVQCDRCERWQHQICALFDNKRDMDCRAQYTCPRCCLKEIEDGMRTPLPKIAIFGAKDLPRTKLSDHIEQRLFKSLSQEREERAKAEGSKNLDEVLAAENLSVRVVLSVDKQLKVKKQFLDIFLEENYPAEFTYKSKVIFLFQKIEGVDVCLFAMYVQEFGSECGYPNHRCVYISYLDSVKYFRPQRETVTGEALRTFVYHEILIGYLDFCKKRGFSTCYIWACPPLRGEDYVLYCHPDTQKTPKNDKLRHWYHLMLRKAAEENIVVGFTNIYDNFFVPTGKCDSKVTAARLPYFDGDYWSAAAMDLARNIEKESGGHNEEKFKKLVTKRTLKAMGHTNPSEGTTKDILVMQKLGQTILPVKEDFIIVHLQYACVHCHEVIVSGKRWFCGECKKFQECERCHAADSHTSVSGENHILYEVFMDDIPSDTKENDITLDSGLFEDRHNFLSFCQKNLFQFDTLRRAKHSSMMILFHLKNPSLLTVGRICSICCKDNVFQQSWQCETCPEFRVCSECYKEKGANCHVHKLSQFSSSEVSQSWNQESKQNLALIRHLQEVLHHASRCHATKRQPCTFPNCLQIKKLFYHASRCTVRAAGGCQHCKKAWLGLTLHSRNCRDLECRIPRCMDLKKHAEWIAMQSESRRRAAVAGCNIAHCS